MTNAFDVAMDHLFTDPNLARAAVYRAQGNEPIAVRVIARRDDQVMDFGDTRVHTGNSLFDVLVSQVQQPIAGDTLEVDGETFVVQGEPMRDQGRLLWTLDVRPQ